MDDQTQTNTHLPAEVAALRARGRAGGARGRAPALRQLSLAQQLTLKVASVIGRVRERMKAWVRDVPRGHREHFLLNLLLTTVV